MLLIIVVVAAAAIVAAVLAVVLTRGDGGDRDRSDKFVGTWTADIQGETLTLKIEKSGDKWVVTDPSSASSEKIEGTEKNGKLVFKDPEGGSQTVTLERKGDALVMTLGKAGWMAAFTFHRASGAEATALPGYQNKEAKNASVIEGIHSLQVAVQSYAVDNGDIYPSDASQATLSSYVDNWPANPFTGEPMGEGTGPGDYSYTQLDNGTNYELVGYGADGLPVITVP